MSLATVGYIGSTIRARFQALKSDGTPANLTGAKLWSGLSLTRTGPPTKTKKNTAMSGGDAQVFVEDAAEGYFVAIYAPDDTKDLPAGALCYIDGWVELTDGSRWPAGVLEFRATHAPSRTPPAAV